MKILNYLPLFVTAVLILPTYLSAEPAIHEYTQAIENSPEDMKYKFYLLRGNAYKYSGEMTLALKDLNTSIMLYPGRTAYKCRGEIYFKVKRYKDAIDDFSAALEINPSSELYKLRGGSYLKTANYVMALADGFNVIEMTPYDSESYYISMEALENLGDIELARELAFRVISFDRGNKKAYKIITKYPLKFVFIDEILYISHENNAINDKVDEIFLMYKKGEKIVGKLKRKLGECIEIGEEIKEFQAQLKGTWDNYFDKARALKIRSLKIHNDLRSKYQKQTKPIEHEIEIWEEKSKKCTEELVQTYWSNE